MIAFLNRSSIRMSRVLRMLLGCCLLATGIGENAEGAPVTLSFEAEIGAVFPGIPFDSGIDFAVGDVISGQFTFEASAGDGSMAFDATQPYSVQLQVGDADFVTSPLRSDLEVQSVNNAIASDYPSANVLDFIGVGSSLTPISESDFPNISLDSSSFRMALRGDSSILAQASHPQEVSVWNSYTLERSLIVSFRGSSGGVIGFQAQVGPFTAIPEPLSLSLCALGIFLVISSRPGRK